MATRSQIQTLTGYTDCPWTRPQLEAYTADTAEAEERYQTEVLGKRVSVLNLLERFPAVELPLAVFLEMTGPIRPRFYSISSAPLANPRHVRLTVGLLEGPALSGDGRYRGTCSSYIAGLEPGDIFYGYVRVPSPTFAPCGRPGHAADPHRSRHRHRTAARLPRGAGLAARERYAGRPVAGLRRLPPP